MNLYCITSFTYEANYVANFEAMRFLRAGSCFASFGFVFGRFGLIDYRECHSDVCIWIVGMLLMDGLLFFLHLHFDIFVLVIATLACCVLYLNHT